MTAWGAGGGGGERERDRTGADHFVNHPQAARTLKLGQGHRNKCEPVEFNTGSNAANSERHRLKGR